MTENRNLIDTNVIIQFPSVFSNLENIHVHLKSIEELDKLKDSDNLNLAYRARKGAKMVKKYLSQITIETDQYKQNKVDDILLHCAKKNKLVLITNDLTLELKCQFSNVKTSSYTNGDTTIYNGIRNIKLLENEKVEDALEKSMLNQTPFENEFLLVNNEELDEKNYFVYKNNDLINIEKKIISNAFERKIQSKNKEQSCLMHALFDNDIKILSVTGTFGVGKSYLTINYAFQQLERGIINKIVYVPNNSHTSNSRELAAVPGGLLEKEIHYMGSLVDIVGYDEIEARMMDGTLEIMPISLARGRNLENAIVLVNEAQNLTEEHIKLLIGRIGENTKIIFDGDLDQTDKSIFRNSNGLKLLYKIRFSEFADLFASIQLKSIERSRTAQVSSYLDSID